MNTTATPSAASPPDFRAIAKQIEVELALLLHIEQALRIALNWRSDGKGNIRKLSTLRFVIGSFERHLTRMRVLSAYGGYMHLVTETKPHLAGAVEDLKKLRDDLQAHLERMMLRLEHLDPNDDSAFEELCSELENYLQDLNAHGQKELELMQHSFAQEEGGSG